DAVVHRLTVIEDLPELRSSHISLKEAEKELKGGAKAYLYFIREHEKGDPDEDFAPRKNSDENSSSSNVDANVHSEGCHVVNSGVKANVVDSGPLAQRHVVNSGSNQANVVDSG